MCSIGQYSSARTWQRYRLDLGSGAELGIPFLRPIGQMPIKDLDLHTGSVAESLGPAQIDFE